MAAVTIAKIEKSFGETSVLTDIDLAIRDGEFLTLVGPSGCGKSTLLRIIAGLEFQDNGSIAIGGRPVDNVPPKDRDLAMVFQSYALYPHLTVAGNMAVPLRMRRQSWLQRLPVLGGLMPGSGGIRHGIEQDILNAATTLGIESLLERKPGQLSGGQRQRVALGRAMVREPAGFLMDEPLSNLDAALRLRMRAELVDLHRALATTFIYVTHDQAEAMTMSDRIAVMMGGEILQCAAPDEIYNNPADIRVAEFIGAPKINILPVDAASDGTLTFFGTDLGLMAQGEGPLRLGIRPEALEMTTGSASINGVVGLIENLGAEVFVQLDVAGMSDRLVVRLDPKQGRVVQLGDPLSLTLDIGASVLFDEAGKRVAVDAITPVQRRAMSGG